jgi:hypothetical protein
MLPSTDIAKQDVLMGSLIFKVLVLVVEHLQNYNFRRTATHEIGQLLGLSYPTEQNTL